MRNGFFIFSVALLALALHGGLRAAEPKVLLSSQVATNGDFLTLPVEIAGKQYSFLVDTGASYSSLNKTFLESLERYDPSEKPIEELDGMWSQTYLAPAMTVCGTESGSLRFPKYALITCFDMTTIQQASDQQIDGILGMDFLAPYALELDLSIGTLRLLDSQTLTETQYDGRIPTQLSPDRRPCITGEANGETFLALVDTGANLSLQLQQKHHALLCEQKKLVPWQIELLIDGQKQVHESHQGTLQELTIGPFTHRQLVAGVDEDISLVGLQYWKRYKATFDFPKGWIYLKKNACFAMLDCGGHAGLWIEPDAEDSKIKTVPSKVMRLVIACKLATDYFRPTVRVSKTPRCTISIGVCPTAINARANFASNEQANRSPSRCQLWATCLMCERLMKTRNRGNLPANDDQLYSS